MYVSHMINLNNNKLLMYDIQYIPDIEVPKISSILAQTKRVSITFTPEVNGDQLGDLMPMAMTKKEREIVLR